jgi:uncharacterized protein YdhG (YjbR/CyaY superfamily)
MQSSARERKAPSRRGSAEERAEGERDLQASIAKMPEPDRSMAERIHGIVMAAVPDLAPKTYYGMPAYAKDGNVICWFKNASKFKTRYATFEFSDKANLDEGAMWPTTYALTGVDGRRRGKDRRPSEEGGELRTGARQRAPNRRRLRI